MCDYAATTNVMLEAACEPTMAKHSRINDEGGMTARRQRCKVGAFSSFRLIYYSHHLKGYREKQSDSIYIVWSIYVAQLQFL